MRQATGNNSTGHSGDDNTDHSPHDSYLSEAEEIGATGLDGARGKPKSTEDPSSTGKKNVVIYEITDIPETKTQSISKFDKPWPRDKYNHGENPNPYQRFRNSNSYRDNQKFGSKNYTSDDRSSRIKPKRDRSATSRKVWPVESKDPASLAVNAQGELKNPTQRSAKREASPKNHDRSNDKFMDKNSGSIPKKAVDRPQAPNDLTELTERYKQLYLNMNRKCTVEISDITESKPQDAPQKEEPLKPNTVNYKPERSPEHFTNKPRYGRGSTNRRGSFNQNRFQPRFNDASAPLVYQPPLNFNSDQMLSQGYQYAPPLNYGYGYPQYPTMLNPYAPMLPYGQPVFQGDNPNQLSPGYYYDPNLAYYQPMYYGTNPTLPKR